MSGPAGRLPLLDRLLPVWIGAAMIAGLLLGRWVPGLGPALGRAQVDGASLPIAAGLLVMMCPVLAKVRYDRLGSVAGDRGLIVGSVVLNWLVGPLIEVPALLALVELSLALRDRTPETRPADEFAHEGAVNR